MTQQGSDLLVMAAPLRDYSGKVVGIIELTRDHSLVAADLARQGWQMAIISLVVALVIAMVMAFALNRINRPLLDSVKALEALANGSGDLGSKLPVAGPEEIRRLGSVFNAFVAKIRDTISQLTATLGELAGESERLSRSEAVSDKECRLGHWYFSEGQACCGDQPAFRAMAAPHARLHQVIQQIIELKNQHKHEEAEALYREIEQNSEQVEGCIDQLLREMTKPER
ncbi:MAG: CZB domain-containing protein [Aeromonas veronii]